MNTMRANMLGGIAASAILAFSSPSSAASPQEDLVRAWLEGSSFGLAVDIGSSRFDPASQSVVLDGVTIGGPDDVLTAGFETLTVEDPRRTPGGMFAAHSIRGSAMDWVVRVDPERWFPELVEAIEDDQDPSDEVLDGGDETPDGEDGAADGDANDSGVTVQTTVSPPFTAHFRADTILYERAVLPMTAPTFADDASIVARYFEIVRWYMPTRVDWVELNGVELATAGLPDGNGATTYGRLY
ncbi:MAG TPA: hypothetical protein VMP03_06725, partial [Methylomirabilota bacterium]|nr:hypothetical protein [Methylomirabilota bacterium]